MRVRTQQSVPLCSSLLLKIFSCFRLGFSPWDTAPTGSSSSCVTEPSTACGEREESGETCTTASSQATVITLLFIIIILFFSASPLTLEPKAFCPFLNRCHTPSQSDFCPRHPPQLQLSSTSTNQSWSSKKLL